MKLERRQRLGMRVPTDSFGDIAFLLIIFFMLASVFMKEGHVKLDPAKSLDIRRLKETPISVSIDEQGVYWVQGKAIPATLLQNIIDPLIRDRRDKTVMLRVDRNLQADDFRPALLALSKAGAEIALIGSREVPEP